MALHLSWWGLMDPGDSKKEEHTPLYEHLLYS
jgi:hypothetical protein